MISSSSKPILTNSNKNHHESNPSINSTNEISSSLTANSRKHNQNSNVNVRTPPPTSAPTPPPPPPPVNIKPDRRKDIKLTNCQEKDGIWTATGQFGRESRHSKRADITYDKKKFRFIQKDDQGNKHVFEIPVTDIEGKKFIRFIFKKKRFSFSKSNSNNKWYK
jgi:hypothetical protein